jgi:hypothetical protein
MLQNQKIFYSILIFKLKSDQIFFNLHEMENKSPTRRMRTHASLLALGTFTIGIEKGAESVL